MVSLGGDPPGASGVVGHPRSAYRAASCRQRLTEDGIAWTLAYDVRHRLASLTSQLCAAAERPCAAPNTSALGHAVYLYDDNDNRTSVDEANGAASAVRTYCYDARNQLIARNTAAGCASASDEAYTYDDAGNRLAATANATTTHFAYTATGQLCAVGATSCASPTVTYDSTGRTATLSGWAFAYDAAGRLVSACQSASCAGSGFNRVDSVYDGEGHRTSITETTAAGAVTTTSFRYQGAAIVAETVTDAAHPAGILTRTYVVDEAGRPLKVCDPDCTGSNPVYRPTWNGHGDALALWLQNADGTLTLANSYTYDTWGSPTTTVAPGFGGGDLGFRFLYVGASDVQWDNSFGLGLLYMHARHYSPSLGRFLQPDPARADANLYGYTGNSPVTKSDPSGLMTAKCWELLVEITRLSTELAMRYDQILANKLDLPRYGRFSIAGHRIQYSQKQSRLRSLLNEWQQSCAGGGGPRPPASCWKWAYKAAPYPAVSNRPSNNVVGVAAGGGVVVTLWWILKLASPLCGPAAPACAMAL